MNTLTIRLVVILFVFLGCVSGIEAQNLFDPNNKADEGSRTADHTVVQTLWQGNIPESAIIAAKKNLKIGYGHTSHGDQLRLGMEALVSFANDGRLGNARYSENLFAISQNGINETLHLFNGAGYNDGASDQLSGDAGWPNAYFASETREFLNNPANASFNVIIWCWCGQLSGFTENDVLNNYLLPMSKLETDYPKVAFIYMTGHLNDGINTIQAANINARNEQIRQYCKINNKWLYDFADIESYDPDGKYFLNMLATDGCNYDKNGDGIISLNSSNPPVATGGDGNWALEWQNNHVEGQNWFQCSAEYAHTQHVNANMKAFAAWWLWARLGGWEDPMTSNPILLFDKITIYPIPTKDRLEILLKEPLDGDYCIKIFNSLGNEILALARDKSVEHSEIDLSAYPSGIYLVSISSQKKTSLYKIVKL